MTINIGGSQIASVTADGQQVSEVTVDGEVVWPNHIEDFEDLSTATWSQKYDGGGTGSTEVTSSAALADGSTQGLRQHDFQEIYAGPDAFQTPLEAGREAHFYFYPHEMGSSQYHFLFGTGTPDAYRIEFHMNSGIRITGVDGGREIFASDSNNPSWSRQAWVCYFEASSSGVTASVGPAGGSTHASISTSRTDHVDSEMPIGWRNSSGEMVDWDYLGYN